MVSHGANYGSVVNLCSHVAVKVGAAGCGSDHGTVVNILHIFFVVLVWYAMVVIMVVL